MKGKINVYKCTSGHETVTIDRDNGVTPLIMICKHISDNHKCTAHSHSGWYMVDQNQVPTHEWYKPEDLSKVPSLEREHVKKGGLLLRKIVKQLA